MCSNGDSCGWCKWSRGRQFHQHRLLPQLRLLHVLSRPIIYVPTPWSCSVWHDIVARQIYFYLVMYIQLKLTLDFPLIIPHVCMYFAFPLAPLLRNVTSELIYTQNGSLKLTMTAKVVHVCIIPTQWLCQIFTMLYNAILSGYSLDKEGIKTIKCDYWCALSQDRLTILVSGPHPHTTLYISHALAGTLLLMGVFKCQQTEPFFWERCCHKTSTAMCHRLCIMQEDFLHLIHSLPVSRE